MTSVQALTNIYIVTSLESSGSTTVLSHTKKGYDGDLFESSWRHKGRRFICYERNPNDNKVVVDMAIIKDDDPVPNGFTGIFLTHDTKEKSLRKHVLCVRRQDKDSAERAIMDIQLIHKGKREDVPAMYYTITMDVNDIQVVYHLGDMARINETSNHTSKQTVDVPLNTASREESSQESGSVPKSPVSGLDGVPFLINPKFDPEKMTQDFITSGLKILSLEEVHEKFNYNFELEEQVNSSS